jgi:hypothetical protein
MFEVVVVEQSPKGANITGVDVLRGPSTQSGFKKLQRSVTLDY